MIEPQEPVGDDDGALSPFLSKRSRVEIHRRHLPHWHLDGGFYYDTWRLGDSLPLNLVLQWKNERADWLRKHPQPWDSETRAVYREQFPQRIEAWLDAGYGACYLRDPACAQIVADAIWHFDAERCRVASFVVMPNHVHLLFQLVGNTKLEIIQHSWKSFTAGRINALVGRKGALWQRESWDRLLRGLDDLERCLSYILLNPVMAGLRQGEYVYYEAPEFGEASGG